MSYGFLWAENQEKIAQDRKRDHRLALGGKIFKLSPEARLFSQSPTTLGPADAGTGASWRWNANTCSVCSSPGTLNSIFSIDLCIHSIPLPWASADSRNFLTVSYHHILLLSIFCSLPLYHLKDVVRE